MIVERLLDGAQIEDLRGRFPLLFAGKFDTGIYPDEWYWREGMSLPDVTRHMANAWKADLTVARLVLSESIGRFAAELCGWRGSRLGQDTIWWKAPKTKPIAYHQDTSFMDFLEPPSTLTCWVTLDDTHRDAGTLEYAPGSHKWPLTRSPERVSRRRRLSGADEGCCQSGRRRTARSVFHRSAGRLLRVPSRRNVARLRRQYDEPTECAAQSVFTCCPRTSASVIVTGGYIYRRYQRTDDPALDESYFPVLWSRSGRRTKWIEAYCESGLRHAAMSESDVRRRCRSTHYAKSGDVHVAFQVFGSGPIDLVLHRDSCRSIENYWDQPDLARWLLRLARFARVVIFDKRGTGLSDPVSAFPSLDLRMDDVRAVMDAAGIERAVLLGISEGGPLATLFAATYPQRCRALVLYGTFAHSSSWITAEGLEAFLRYIDQAWGSGRRLSMFAPSRRNDPRLAAMVGPLRAARCQPGRRYRARAHDQRN